MEMKGTKPKTSNLVPFLDHPGSACTLAGGPGFSSDGKVLYGHVFLRIRD
jgi:hypothetical protein